MTITKNFYGKTTDKKEVNIFTLTNSNDLQAKIINYGGILVSLFVPDKNGKFHDIVLGYDRLEGYLKNKPYFGATIGRYANRIKDARFKISDTVYNLTKNEGENQLHGGFIGFDKVLWQAEIVNMGQDEALELSYVSKDDEEGYPGNLDTKVIYTLTEDNCLKIDYFAVSDKDTAVNLTNHSYFNLSGHGPGNILKHQVMINADKFTVNDRNSIPTGEIHNVKETPMDFTKLTTIEPGIFSNYDQIVYANGYDNNWVLNVNGKITEKAAEVFDNTSGRVMEVYTTKPGIQLYTGNYIDESEYCKDGVKYGKNSGLCLETQHFPNAVNCKHFPSPTLKAGDTYRHTTIYKFSIR
ncbi:aldose epimerase family protein [Clostridium sp. DJ247]|uniref:aldose epimerase family protein n=1 Tax=Clostridium sp. DJ247 TaxID=2726188 RepID=UPI0016279A0D|nr:aldose epimerase family protein [Clostridium sp. DJ247]MBC2581966.1 galactose mutarotase [Clostridium sp. DJ247]